PAGNSGDHRTLTERGPACPVPQRLRTEPIIDMLCAKAYECLARSSWGEDLGMTRRRIVGGIITLTLALGGSVLAATRGGAAAGQGRLVGIQGCVLTFEFRGFSSTDRG